MNLLDFAVQFAIALGPDLPPLALSAYMSGRQGQGHESGVRVRLE
jgi:hypothetical protein